MFKTTYLIILSILILSCGSTDNKAEEEIVPFEAKTDTTSFFPLAEFLDGQVYEVKNTPVNPVYFTRSGGSQSDTIWLKNEQLDSVLNDFKIISWNNSTLSSSYHQDRFFDRSLPAITFTYTLIPGKEPLNGLQNWSVYIDPKTEKVYRLFMVRTIDGKTFHLTWQVGEWAKKVALGQQKENNMPKEEFIIWDLNANP